MTKVESAMDCGVVDLQTGAVLGASGPSFNAESATAVAALFASDNIATIEHFVQGTPDRTTPLPLGEVHITSSERFHFCRPIANGRVALVLVTERCANVGMAWAHLKSHISDVESCVV